MNVWRWSSFLLVSTIAVIVLEMCIFLQSLTDGDRVNRDGELVDDNDDAEEDGHWDAGKVKVPSFHGSPAAVDSSSASNTSDGGSSDIRLGAVGDAVAITLGALWVVVVEGEVDSKESKEGNDQGTQDHSSNSEESNAKHVHAEHEQKLVADGAGKAHHKEDREDTGEDQSNENEGLNKLHCAPDRGGRIVLIESASLETSCGADESVGSVKRPCELSRVHESFSNGSIGGRWGELVVLSV